MSMSNLQTTHKDSLNYGRLKLYSTIKCKEWSDKLIPYLIELFKTDAVIPKPFIIATAHGERRQKHNQECKIGKRGDLFVIKESSDIKISICFYIH